MNTEQRLSLIIYGCTLVAVGLILLWTEWKLRKKD